MPSVLRKQTSTLKGYGKKQLNSLPPHSYPMTSGVSLLIKRGTKMPMMPPGSETGVYYMPIGNLPWNVTWQDLKDFTRDPQDGLGPCDVEHAEVYRTGRNSRSGGHGYVKIRGERDFWRVYNYLNGREWKTRCLQPDCRNATQWIPLSDVHSGSVTSTTQAQRNGSASSSSSRRPSNVDSIISQDPSWTTAAAMAQPPVNQAFGDPNWGAGYYQQNTPIQNPQYPFQQGPNQVYPQYSYPTPENMALANYQQNSTYAMTPTSMPYMASPETASYQQMASNMLQNIANYQVNYAPSITNRLPTTDQDLASYFSTMTLQQNTTPLVETEARKILIYNLPHHVKPEDIRKHIAYHATSPPGLDKDAVEDLDLPTHNDTKKRRGHAFAVLKNSSMAARCIQALNGQEFMGRELGVKLTKEGVAVPRRTDDVSGLRTSRASGSSSRHGGGGGGSGGGSERKGSDKDRRSGKAATSSSSSSKWNQGSIATAASTTDDPTITGSNLLGTAAKRSRPGTPIVVDSSSPCSSRAPSMKAPSSITSTVSASSNRSENRGDREQEEKRSEKAEGKRRR